MERIIQRLETKIKGKTVCILAHGKSIEEFEKRIEEFRGTNAVFVGFSNFAILEEYILKKIDRDFDVVFNFAPGSVLHCIPIINYDQLKEYILCQSDG